MSYFWKKYLLSYEMWRIAKFIIIGKPSYNIMFILVKNAYNKRYNAINAN